MRFFPGLFAALGFSVLATPLPAAPTGLLYDPEPPPDSAYVRVINPSPDPIAEIRVDGKPRIKALAARDASEYLVLPAGKRTLGVGSANVTVDVVAGRAISVALDKTGKPSIFEDKANTNMLKAVLAIYHLDEKAPALDVLAANGATKVVTGLKPGTSRALSVNPIKVELAAVAEGTTAALATTSLGMAAGGTYSVFVFAGPDGKPVARAIQNKVERYAGK